MSEQLTLLDRHLEPGWRRRTRAVAARIAIGSMAAVSVLTAAGATTANAAELPPVSFTASAFGSSVNVGTVVKSGPSAYLTLGCTTNGTLFKTNKTAGLDLGLVGRVGAVTTTAQTYASPAKSKTSAQTAGVNLLLGLVKADAIKTISATTRSETGAYSVSSTGTTVTNLKVAGVSVNANAAPNTKITLPGVGYVVVNEQVKTSKSLTVTGLHVVVDVQNTLNLLVGTDIKISQSVSGLSGPVAGVVGGFAYGTKAVLGSVVASGQTFPAYMPCLGTGGAVRSNSGADAGIGLVLKSGTVTNTVKGTITSKSAEAISTSTVESINLLNGLVEATALKSVATARTDGTTPSVSSEGSSFGALKVAGRPTIGVDVAPNTKINVAGVGTLYLNRVVKTAKYIEVRQVELVLTSPVNGLAIGTSITVGVARATVS